jgi:hypothetical protein
VFSNLYQGLQIDELILHAERNPTASPTLKEITAVVRAAHKLIERIDGALLQNLDLEEYFKETLRRYLMGDAEGNPGSASARASKVWSKSPDRRRSALIQIAHNSGFAAYRDGAPNKLSAAVLDDLADMSPKEAVSRLTK